MTDVLVVCEYASLNGGEQSFLSVLDGLRASGFNITVAAPARGELADELSARQVIIRDLVLYDEDGQRKSVSQTRDHLQEIIESESPDLVHANSLSMSRLCGPVASKLRIPSIGHLRDIVRLSTTAISDLNRNSRLLAVSRATRDWHVDAGLDSEKTFVAHNGVDLVQFQPRSPSGYLHCELGLASDIHLIGSIGQIGMRKGLDNLLEAMSIVVSRIPEAHLLIVGKRFSGKQESCEFELNLKRLASVEPLAGHVHFLGWRNDISELMHELSLLVHAARQEPLGRVLLEAAASGVPIVATDVGGTREIFDNGKEAARLVQPDEPAELAQAINEVLGDSAIQSRLSESARNRAEAAFDANVAATDLASHYNAVLLERFADQD